MKLKIKSLVQSLLGSFIFKGSFVSLLLKIFGLVLAYTLQWIIVDQAGTTQYGIYVFVVNSAMLYGSFAFLGFISSIDRFLAQYFKASNFPALRGFLKTAYSISFFSNLLTAGLFVAVIWLFFPNHKYGYALYLLLLIMPFFALMRLNSKVFIASRKVFNGFFPNQVLRYIFPLLIIITSVFVLEYPIESAFEMLSILIISLILVIVYQITRIVQLPMINGIKSIKSHYEFPLWLKTSVQLFLVGSFSVILNRIDIQILAIYYEPFEVGEYNIARRVSDLAMFVHASVISVIGPIIASNIDNKDKIKKVIRRANHLIFWPTLMAAIFLFLISGPLFNFFSSEYVNAEKTAMILVAGHLSVAFFGPLAVLINMTGNQRFSVKLFAGAAILNVVLNFALIPTYGIIGAAIATAVVQFLLYFGMFAVVKKIFGFFSSVLHV